MNARQKYTKDSSDCDSSRHTTSEPPVRVTVTPLPMPPEVAERLAKVYAYIRQRGSERREAQRTSAPEGQTAA